MSETDVSLAGRVAIVTGAGAGLGRAEALELARAGASVIVNDLAENDAVSATLADIRALGAKAEFVAGSIAERSTADALLQTAEETFGGLDIIVNNAGITRDKMLFNMSDEDFDAVIAVHLRGHFLLTRNAGAYWRAKSKEAGAPVYGRIVNTSSEAGLLGPAGQANYGAAKAGITALTLSASRALSAFGVTANAIAPRARTSMTEKVFSAAPEEGPDPLSLITWHGWWPSWPHRPPRRSVGSCSWCTAPWWRSWPPPSWSSVSTPRGSGPAKVWQPPWAGISPNVLPAPHFRRRR